MKAEDVFGGFLPFSIISITIGFVMIFKKRTMVDAFLSSYKTIAVGFTVDEERFVRIANVMAPIMGVLFMIAGIASLVKVVIYLT